MNKELINKNLNTIKKAVANNLELLVNNADKNSLQAVSAKEWNEEKNKNSRDSAKFLISKTIAYCSSVFEEDMQITNTISAISAELTKYLTKRNMANLAELINDLKSHQKAKGKSQMDYPSDRFGT